MRRVSLAMMRAPLPRRVASIGVQGQAIASQGDPHRHSDLDTDPLGYYEIVMMNGSAGATSLTAGSPEAVRVVPAMVARPERPLGPIDFLKTATSNTLGICDAQVFEQLIVQRRYGPFRIAFVSNPEGVRRILVEQPDAYPRLSTIRRLYAAEIGTGTLASDGETWRRHRRVATAVIDRRAFGPDLPALASLAAAETRGWCGRLGAEPFNMEAEVAALWVTLFNHEVTGGDPAGIPIIAWLKKVPRKPRLLDILPAPSMLRQLLSRASQTDERAGLSARLRGMIEQRQQPGYGGAKDLLWRIAHAADRRTGDALPLDEMRDEAASLTAAGDAAIRALTWFWYLLALRPDVEARVHAEIDRVVACGPIEPRHLVECPYTRAVLDEVLRLYPPIPVMVRQARRSDEVCGERIRRGTYIFVMPWVIHRHRRLWDDPDAFDPDRFLGDRGGERSRYAYIPFSVGMRVCSASSYALAQMTIILLTLARRYRFRPVPDRPVRPVGGISLQPRGGLWMTLERR